MSIAIPPHVVEPAFEIVAFRAQPADGGVAVLELHGRFTGSAPRRFDRARLRVERPGQTSELSALHDAADTSDGWSATFAVPVGALQDATFALAIGRGLLLDLPAPDVHTPDGSPAADYVRVAREANHNRRQLLEVRIALGAEQEARALVQRHADQLTAELDTVVAQRDEAQAALRSGLEELDAERERASAAAAQELAGVQATHELSLAEARATLDQTLAELRAGHAQEIEQERAQVAAARSALEAAQFAPSSALDADPLGAHAAGETDELRTLEAPPRATAPAHQELASRSRELLSAALAADNRPRTIALSVLALAFVAFAAALGVGPL